MKYLCLDIGNVICKVDFTHFITKMIELIGITKNEAQQFLIDMQQDHDKGLIYIKDALHIYGDKISANKDILIEEWNKTVIAEATMINWIRHLTKNEVKIALLSNMGWEHAAIIRDILSHTIYDKSHTFLSCNMGVRKPMQQYYEQVIANVQELRGSVYLDDRPENIEAGIVAGFNAQLFELDKEPDLSKRLIEIEKLIMA